MTFAIIDLHPAYRQDGSAGLHDEPLYHWAVYEQGNDIPVDGSLERDLASEDANTWQVLADRVLTDSGWARIGEWSDAGNDTRRAEVARS